MVVELEDAGPVEAAPAGELPLGVSGGITPLEMLVLVLEWRTVNGHTVVESGMTDVTTLDAGHELTLDGQE